MQMHEVIDSVSETLSDSLGKTIARIERGAEEINQDEVFDTLVHIGELKHIVRDVEGKLNSLLTEHMRMNGDKFLERGSYTAERKIASTRKNWDHQVLLEAVVNKALAEESSIVVDPATGEVIDLSTVAKPLIDTVVDHVTKAARVADWRVTALRAMIPGLNPDDFCEVEKSERVSIRKKQ